MKLELERSNFLKAWQIAEKYTAAQQRDSLGGIRITASGDIVTLEATDLKSSVKCPVRGAKVEEAGVAVLNAAFFGNLLRKTTAKTITLTVNDTRGILEADKSRSRFPVIPAKTFPNIPESSGAENICSIMASDFGRVITEGSCAASAPSDFPKYMGACMLKIVEDNTAKNSTAENNATENNTAENNAAENNATENNTAENNTAENNAAENNATENNTAENNTAENNAAENNTAENNTAENNTAENNATENNTAKQYIIVVSTDGRRLARAKTLCSSFEKAEELVLPAAALKETAKNLTGDGTVKVLADGSTVWFMLERSEIVKEETSAEGNTDSEGGTDSETPTENYVTKVEVMEFSLQRIETSYPKYEKILNNEVRTTLKVLKSALLPALERVDLVAKTNSGHVMAMFLNPNPDPDKPPLRITARAPELGTASEGLNAHIEGDGMQIGFNAAFFLDGLKAVTSDSITVEFSSDEGQTRILKDAGDDFLYMLMPIRLTPQDIVPDDDSGDFTAPEYTDEFPQEDDEDEDSQDDYTEQDEAQPYDDSDAPF